MKEQSLLNLRPGWTLSDQLSPFFLTNRKLKPREIKELFQNVSLIKWQSQDKNQPIQPLHKAASEDVLVFKIIIRTHHVS